MPRLSLNVLLVLSLFLLSCFALPQASTDHVTLDKIHPQKKTTRSVPTRAEFDDLLLDWSAQNPQLRADLDDDSIETLWRQLQPRQSKRQDDVVFQARAVNETGSSHKPLTSESDIEAAKELIAAAQEKIVRVSKDLEENPRRNEYVLGNKEKRAAHVGSVHVDQDVRHAAAALAELDAAKMKEDGTLYKEYRIAKKSNAAGTWEYSTVQAQPADKTKRGHSYWLPETVGDNYGSQPLGGDSDYKVWRNVKDYGAKGNGWTDDTEAINKAIADGDRCGENCQSSSVKGATVYFPPGLYLVSSPIIALYNTQLIGDAVSTPVIMASRSFTGLGVISSDVYYENGDGASWYLNTGNFYRQVRSLLIDIELPTQEATKGIHWQVAQACSLQNLHLKMKPGSSQVGIFMENGSGGFFSDLTFEGGESGLLCGNQQFTSRDLLFDGCTNAISMLWDWGWTWKGIDIRNAKVGINYKSDGFEGGSLVLLDSTFSSVETGIVTDLNEVNKHQMSIVLRNFKYDGVSKVVESRDSGAGLNGHGSGHYSSWIMGNVHEHGTDDGEWKNGKYVSRVDVPHGLRASDSDDPTFFARSKPLYEDSEEGEWLMADILADGKTDQTAKLSFYIAYFATHGGKMLLPAGTIVVSDTIDIIPGSIISGICWTQIMATGDKFSDESHPRPLIRVGKPGDEGVVELQDLLFTARGPTAGLVAVEWNIKGDDKGSAAMWDCHVRIGGAKGTDLQLADCPKLHGVNDQCKAGALLIHLTKSAGAYFENVWAWVADHDLDSDAGEADGAQIDLYVGRGILIESTEPTWLYGTASEHCVQYQYSLVKAENVFMGMIQTESPYYLPDPVAPNPYSRRVASFRYDPQFNRCDNDLCRASWGLAVLGSKNIFIGGAGLYSWFYDKYSQDCLEGRECQQSMVLIDTKSSQLDFMNIITIGATEMITTTMRKNPILAEDNAMLVREKPWASNLAIYKQSKSVADQNPNDLFTNTASMPERYLKKIPEKCLNVDKCPDEISDGLVNERKLEATTDRGYLCIIQWFWDEWYEESDGLLEDEGGENWDLVVFDRVGFSNSDCENPFSGDSCTMNPSCGDYDDPAIFWALAVLTNFHKVIVDVNDAAESWTNYADFNYVDDLADALLLGDEKEENGLAKVFGALSQGLGLLMGGFELAGDAAPSEKTLSALTAIGTVFDDISQWLPEEEDGSEELKSAIHKGLDYFYLTIKNSLDKTNEAVFEKCDVSDWPDALFPDIGRAFGSQYGLNRHGLAQLVADQRFVIAPGSDQTDLLNYAIQNATLLGLMNVGLQTKSYYILRDALEEGDCNTDDNPGAAYMDGHCYILHHAGEGWQQSGASSAEAYSVPIPDKVVGAINDLLEPFTTGDHKALEYLYKNAIECQGSSSSYSVDDDVSTTFSIPNLVGKGPGASCFVNIPILYVSPRSDLNLNLRKGTPCETLDHQKSTDERRVGYYLPDYLFNIFGHNAFCNAGTTCHGLDCPCAGGAGPNCA